MAMILVVRNTVQSWETVKYLNNTKSYKPYNKALIVHNDSKCSTIDWSMCGQMYFLQILY